jgi:hypothetical protein
MLSLISARLGAPEVGRRGMSMLQLLRGIVLIAAIILNCEEALAEDISTANYVMPGCREFLTRTSEAAFAQGYCAGTVRALVYAASGVCAPLTGTNEQAVRVVVEYIDSQPVRLHEGFIALAREALRAAWPCNK